MYSAEEEDLAFTLVLDSMIVTEGDLSAKVKAHVRERLGEDYLPWDRVRVREKIECRLGTAMKRGKTLKQTVSALRDGVELALQVVAVRPRPSSFNRGPPAHSSPTSPQEDAKAELDEAEMVLETRHFCPATMELKRGEELGLLKDSSVLALRTVIGTTPAASSSCVRRGNGVQTRARVVSRCRVVQGLSTTCRCSSSRWPSPSSTSSAW